MEEMGKDFARSEKGRQNSRRHSGAGRTEKRVGSSFKPQFGIDMELLTARGPQNASRIASEYQAGVKYFDAFIGGSGTYESLVYEGMVEALAPNLILPDVKEEKYWWGGHIWEDNVKTKRFLYSFVADAGTGGFWYNTEVVKPEELRSLDEFLQPQVERQNRISRSQNSRLRPIHLVFSLGRQRRELSAKTRAAGSFC